MSGFEVIILVALIIIGFVMITFLLSKSGKGEIKTKIKPTELSVDLSIDESTNTK